MSSSRGRSSETERELTTLPFPRLACPECGTPTPEIQRGRELEIVSMEIEEEPRGAGVAGGAAGAEGCYSSFLKASGLRPASLAMPPMVKAFTGSWRGIVTIRAPSVITMCFAPSRAIVKPALRRARTAARCGTPGIFGTV